MSFSQVINFGVGDIGVGVSHALAKRVIKMAEKTRMIAYFFMGGSLVEVAQVYDA